MPVKLRRAKRVTIQITREAVAAYRAADVSKLMLELGMAPWECSPLWCDDGPRPEHWHCDGNWERAQELRRALDAAIAGEMQNGG